MRPLFRLIPLVALALPAAGALIGTNPPAQPLTAERIARLPASEQAPWRDYLERSNQQRRADQAFVAAELKAAGLQRPVVPREGRGGMPLDREADWYAGPEARHVAEVIVSYQTPNGGWSKNLDMHGEVRRPGDSFIADNASPVKPIPGDYGTSNDPHWNYFSTIDNDATTTQLRFLARVITAVGPDQAAADRAAFLRGVVYLLQAQYPNGGWPQVWPLNGGYHDDVTFNDDAMVQVLEVLQGVAGGRPPYAFTGPELRQRAAAAVAAGIRCILDAQIVVNGRRTVWCQQHDVLTLAPTSARNYEPPVECSAESASLTDFLMAQPDPSPEIVAAVHAAAAWLEKAAIHDRVWTRYGRRSAAPSGGAAADSAGARRPRPKPGVTHLVPSPGAPALWARYYQIGTDLPVYGDRDKSIHDRIEEISVERQNGYQWFNSRPAETLARYGEWRRAHPAPSS
ncbi:MAG TPA: pectate lyase [Opitutaceae bacterium]|nr:pectate lyase [Opitutaceae bacterium]